MKNIAELKQDYEQVTGLYERADAIISTIATLPEEQRAEYFRVAAPLAAALEGAADTLTTSFIQYAEGKGEGSARRKTVEGALRKVFNVFDHFRNDAKQASAAVSTRLLAHVEGVHEALGKALVAFAQFVELSLDLIMQKADAEVLRQREPKIAQMLQQLATANSPARS